MTAADVARALVEAALAGDRERVGSIAAEDATWTTPRGSTRRLADAATELGAPGDGRPLAVAREGHRYEEVGRGRVLVRYETVYRWPDEGLENRVPSGYVVDVRDGRVASVRAYLDEGKAAAAARSEAAAA